MAPIVAAIALAIVPLSPASAQAADSHVVTVSILELNQIAVVGGDATLFVVPGGPTPTTNESCDLLWFVNAQGNKKITVRSSLVAPRYDLTVEARNLRGLNGQDGGTSAGVVPLRDGVDRDLITRIREKVGLCDLRYSASAPLAAPLGADVHVVTYTLTKR